MIILPSIDIKDGQCVRLYQGDYAQITTYDTDPVQVAQRWQAAGASWLHLVDLDGAAAGQPVNIEQIASIRATTSLSIELGGGLRTLAHIASMLDLGINRVILGTIALTNRPLLDQALSRWGNHIAVGLDARNGQVAISGWRETSHVQATSLATELAAGVPRFIYTDISRDGTLNGPNLHALREMQKALMSVANSTPTTPEGAPPSSYMVGAPLAGALGSDTPTNQQQENNSPWLVGAPLAGALETSAALDAPPEGTPPSPYMVGAPLAGALETSNALDAIHEGEAPPSYMVGAPLAGALPADNPVAPRCALIASGGVRSLADLHSLASLGIEGAIVGKALYTGNVNLATAIQQIER